MKQNLRLLALPEEVGNESLLKAYLQKKYHFSADAITEILYHKKSIDARSKQVKIHLDITVFMDEVLHKETPKFRFQAVHHSPEVLIVGAGPAGLFAALQLLELGWKPVIFERGKDVKKRRRDLANITKLHLVNPESNYCFGEGGAGTYSDGKLYTRSNKRGDVKRILKLLVYHGADEKILYENHPHIGTNKLPQIIEAMRRTILEYGGEIYFEKKMTDLIFSGNQLQAIVLNGNERIASKNLILATGHSARDVFELLAHHHISISPKPFAMGVRIEHPQHIIDKIQYKCEQRSPFLPPASYQLVEQVGERGVFSFCMCPGGIIAPTATATHEIVVNGWSPSKRDSPFANSGFVSSVDAVDFKPFQQHHHLSALRFQQSVEQACFAAGDGTLKAPAQNLLDFMNQQRSAFIPKNSYLPGTNSVLLDEVLPPQITQALRNALFQIQKKMPAYITNEAVLLATESRTSSPVRIPRDKESLQHIQLQGLYPCGEGAGYAGGIMSAAIDGENCAKAIVRNATIK